MELCLRVLGYHLPYGITQVNTPEISYTRHNISFLFLFLIFIFVCTVTAVLCTIHFKLLIMTYDLHPALTQAKQAGALFTFPEGFTYRDSLPLPPQMVTHPCSAGSRTCNLLIKSMLP